MHFCLHMRHFFATSELRNGAAPSSIRVTMQSTTHPARRLLTTREVATRLALSPDRVRSLAAEGVLPAIQYTARGQLRFRPEDVERLLQPRGVGGGPD